MGDDRLHVAIDLGAGSGRVFLASLGASAFVLEEVRRFTYPPRVVDGHLRWDARRIVDEIRDGLAAAAWRARARGQGVESVGVDSWGVDYGLVDDAGRLVEDPICYRDVRTNHVLDQAFARIPREELVERTGIQVMPFNTAFQLHAHVRAGFPRAARRLLLMPDLVHAFLCGAECTEFTNATTTQLVSASTGTWDDHVIDRLGLPRDVFAPIVPAGHALGSLRAELAADTGLDCRQVVAPATHDTGSAVAGTPLRQEWAFISSGTWSLVGLERPRPLITRDVARHNVTNEGGVAGTTRFLKNVAGLWLLECCRREWQAAGVACDYDDLLPAAERVDETPCLVCPDDPRFLNPPRMLDAIAAQLRETAQPVPVEPAVITRVILDSLALRYAAVLSTLEALSGTVVDGIHIVGGGSRNAYLNRATASAAGKPVLAGPVEATVVGNVVVQALTAGRFASLAEGRRYVAAQMPPVEVRPVPSAVWDRLRRQYVCVEAHLSSVTRRAPECRS